MLMTITEYARHRGCDLKAVQYAVSQGRITRDQRGFIESEQADIDWQNNTNHARARYAPKKARSQPSFSTHAHRDPVIDIEAGKRRAEPSDDFPGGSLTFAKARAVKEFYEARLKKLEFLEKQGNLVPKQTVEAGVFDQFRALRDAILNVPHRVAGQLAAETDPLKVHELLEGEIRLALETFAGEEPI